MRDSFDRKISFGGVALVNGRIKFSGKVRAEIKEYLETLLKKHRYFYDAPFLWVGLIFQYGIKNDLKVKFERIDKKYRSLDIALELDMQVLQWADQNNLVLLKDIFMIAALEALLQVCDKYNLPKEIIAEERSKYGNIPNTIEECEMYGK